MKKLVLFLFSLMLLIGCNGSNSKDNVVANATTSMKIKGMTCEEMCAGRIEEKIARIEGVKSCEVDFENEIATLYYDKKKVDINNIVIKVEDMNDGQYSISEVNTKEITTTTDSEINSAGGDETGQILTAPNFELPNIAEYFRNII